MSGTGEAETGASVDADTVVATVDRDPVTTVDGDAVASTVDVVVLGPAASS